MRRYVVWLEVVGLGLLCRIEDTGLKVGSAIEGIASPRNGSPEWKRNRSDRLRKYRIRYGMVQDYLTVVL